MKALLKKDAYFILDMKPQIIITIIGIIASLTLVKINPDFSLGFINSYFIILGSMIAASTITYDEENNALCYLLSMAISRKTYVNSKYMLALLSSIGTGVFIAIFSLAIKIISGQIPFPFSQSGEISPLELLKLLIIIEVFSSSLALIFNSLALPSFLKYGSKKGVAVTSIGLLVIIAIIVSISYTMISHLGHDQFIATLAKSNILNSAIIAVIIAAITMIISYGLSQKIIKSKEF